MIYFYLIFISIIFGPLGQIPLGISDVRLYVSDLVALGAFLLVLKDISKYSAFFYRDAITRFFLIFTGVAALSLLATSISMDIREWAISGLYLIRMVTYFCIYLYLRHVTTLKKIKPGSIYNGLMWAGVVICAIGWFQYVLYPDLRNLFYLGWDPHLNRIFSTYFDPNFLGLMLVFTIILIWKKLISDSNRPVLFLLIFVVFITLAFTYSRGSYLALSAATIYFAVVKRKLMLIGMVGAVLAVTMVLLPRSMGHGVLLERVFSIEQRIENFKQGMTLFAKYPILGVGFNATRYAKQKYGYSGNPSIEDHSGAGFDNSLLFVAVTTGIIGYISYILLLSKVYSYISLIGRTTLVAAVTHSMFVNSLFYPWVMLWLWVIVACDSSKGNK